MLVPCDQAKSPSLFFIATHMQGSIHLGEEGGSPGEPSSLPPHYNHALTLEQLLLFSIEQTPVTVDGPRIFTISAPFQSVRTPF